MDKLRGALASWFLDHPAPAVRGVRLTGSGPAGSRHRDRALMKSRRRIRRASQRANRP